MKRFSNGVLWAALLFFAAAYCSVFLARSEAPRRFVLLNVSHAIVAEVYADEITETNQGGIGFFRDGHLVASIRPLSDLTVEEFPTNGQFHKRWPK